MVYEELKDRVGHENNMIIHGVQESKAAAGKEREVNNLKRQLELPVLLELNVDLLNQTRFSKRLCEVDKRKDSGLRLLLIELKRTENKELLWTMHTS